MLCRKIRNRLDFEAVITSRVIGEVAYYNGTEVSCMGKLVCPLCGDDTSSRRWAARL